jgi:Flp pilus assembly pilin Flp
MTVKAPCRRTLPRARRFGQNAINLWQETSGGVAIEYGLIAALIAVAIIGSLVGLRDALVGLPLQTIIDAIAGVLS